MSGSNEVLKSVFHEKRKTDEHGSDNNEPARTRPAKGDGASVNRQTDTKRSCKAAWQKHPGTLRKVAFSLSLDTPGDPFDQVVLVAAAGLFAKYLDVPGPQLGYRHPLQCGDLFAHVHRHDRTPSCSRGR